jgi:hypothetical protein
MGAMKPSEVRAQVLSGHSQLRRLLEETDRLASSELDKPGSAETLRVRIAEFAATFIQHLEFEEAVLRPVLASIDAWGQVRAERMDLDHAEQRGRIFELKRQAGDPAYTTPGLARRMRQLAVDLREDMEWEEREMLHENLLRDDILNIGQTGG